MKYLLDLIRLFVAIALGIVTALIMFPLLLFMGLYTGIGLAYHKLSDMLGGLFGKTPPR